MKHTLPRAAAGLLAACTLCTALPACTSAIPDTQPPCESTPHTVADATLAAYQAQIRELESTILALRQEDFINRAAYEARIAALEAELATLRKTATDTPTDTSSPAGTLPPPSSGAQLPVDTAPSPAAYRYEVRDGHAIILTYTGEETQITLPDTLGGAPVTAIADDAFRSCTAVSITLPDTVTSIGWFAFADNPTLTLLTLPASVSSIGYGAFDGCPALTIRCPPDSYASDYAESFGLKHTHP